MVPLVGGVPERRYLRRRDDRPIESIVHGRDYCIGHSVRFRGGTASVGDVVPSSSMHYSHRSPAVVREKTFAPLVWRGGSRLQSWLSRGWFLQCLYPSSRRHLGLGTRLRFRVDYAPRVLELASVWWLSRGCGWSCRLKSYEGTSCVVLASSSLCMTSDSLVSASLVMVWANLLVSLAVFL